MNTIERDRKRLKEIEEELAKQAELLATKDAELVKQAVALAKKDTYITELKTQIKEQNKFCYCSGVNLNEINGWYRLKSVRTIRFIRKFVIHF